MTLLTGDYGVMIGLGALAMALAAAAGAATARSPLHLGLYLSAFGAALAASMAGFGAAGAGLIAVAGLGAVGPLVVIAAFALSPQAARLRKDGPPLGSIAVAAALAAALVLAGGDIAPLGRPPATELGVTPVSLLISLGALAVAAAALGAYALLGHGERAESLRPPRRRRALKARLPDEEPS